jgi:hypothetical protein
MYRRRFYTSSVFLCNTGLFYVSPIRKGHFSFDHAIINIANYSVIYKNTHWGLYV